MKRNYKDVETIINLTGSYIWSGRIVIKKSDAGFDVGGFEFETIEAACKFIENYPNYSYASKKAKVGLDLAKTTVKSGAKIIGYGLRRTGRSIEKIGNAIKDGLDK